MKHLATSFAATGAIQLANLASGILAARLLLPEGRGELAAIVLWPALIAGLGGLSLNSAAAFFSARERERVREIFAVATALSAVVAPAVTLLGFAILPLVYAGYPEEVRGLARLYLAFVALNVFGLSYLSILQGRLVIGAFNALRTILPVANVALILGAMALGEARVGAFVAASLGANAIVLVLAAALLVRAGWTGCRGSVALLQSMLRYALSVHAGYLVTVASQRLDQAFIALILSPADLGFYVVALAAGGVGNLAAGTMDMLAFPKVAAAAPAARPVVLGRYLRATTALAVLAALSLVPLLPWLIELFFGRTFLPSAPAARVIAVSTIPFAFKTVLHGGLRAYDRPFLVAKVETLVLAVFAAALALLLPRFGILGAAWAVLSANLAGCTLLTALVRRELGLSPAALLAPTDDDWRRLRGWRAACGAAVGGGSPTR
jgi:O-antigen/teichoic acid export membrane protein